MAGQFPRLIAMGAAVLAERAERVLAAARA